MDQAYPLLLDIKPGEAWGRGEIVQVPFIIDSP